MYTRLHDSARRNRRDFARTVKMKFVPEFSRARALSEFDRAIEFSGGCHSKKTRSFFFFFFPFSSNAVGRSGELAKVRGADYSEPRASRHGHRWNICYGHEERKVTVGIPRVAYLIPPGLLGIVTFLAARQQRRGVSVELRGHHRVLARHTSSSRVGPRRSRSPGVGR